MYYWKALNNGLDLACLYFIIFARKMQEKNLKRCVRFRFILSTGVAVLHAPFVLTHSERFLLFAKYRSIPRGETKKRTHNSCCVFFFW